MKKYLFALLLLSSCSSISQSAKNISNQTIIFAESSGKIELKINKKGQWESIESTGSAALNAENEHEIEQAMIKATLRAKANLAEFIENDIKSSKSSSTSSNLTKEESDKNKLISDVNEVIKSESSIILVGVYVVERKVSDNSKYVYVKIRSDRAVKNAIIDLR